MKKKVSQKSVQKQVETFEKNNPEITKAMKLFDLSMKNYEQTLRSLEPVKIITASYTKVL